jgi:hypothetical protein
MSAPKIIDNPNLWLEIEVKDHKVPIELTLDDSLYQTLSVHYPEFKQEHPVNPGHIITYSLSSVLQKLTNGLHQVKLGYISGRPGRPAIFLFNEVSALVTPIVIPWKDLASKVSKFYERNYPEDI